jgi:solute carrier family 45 protein 1/2/4
MSSSRPDGASSSSSSSSSSPLGSPNPPKLDTSSQQRPRPRPKLVSFGRDTSGGGRPTAEGRPHVDFIEEVTEHSPFIQPGRMSREIDPLLKETMSPMDDDDWQGEQQTEETKSSWFLFLLTFGGLGLQIGWSVETSNGSVSHTFSCCSARIVEVQILNILPCYRGHFVTRTHMA